MSQDTQLLNADGQPLNPPPPPTHPDGSPKKQFDVRMRMHPGGEIEKAIFVDGEKLDWSIDVSAYMEACKMGLQYKLAVQNDIAKHFVNSVGEILGRHITVEEIKAAIKTGWI